MTWAELMFKQCLHFMPQQENEKENKDKLKGGERIYNGNTSGPNSVESAEKRNTT